jgi:dihydrofolate reductase
LIEEGLLVLHKQKIMRKIIVTEFITLDGVIEAPGGDETAHPHGGWQRGYHNPETGKYKVDELAGVEALLLGRLTYDVFAGYWPSQNDESFGKPINRMPKYVVSTTLKKSEWNNCQILRDVARDVAELRKGDGGDILVYGSATVAKALLHHGLVDELHLLLYPVTVGGGVRLFDDSREMKKFELKHSQVMDNGVILLEYRPIA